MATFNFGTDEARKQRDQYKGDAKELINGEALDSDDGGPLEGADDMAQGVDLPGKGKSFGK